MILIIVIGLNCQTPDPKNNGSQIQKDHCDILIVNLVTVCQNNPFIWTGESVFSKYLT